MTGCPLSPVLTALSPVFHITGQAPPNEGACPLVRIGRIELPTRPWQGRVLPLNHIRLRYIFSHSPSFFNTLPQRQTIRTSQNHLVPPPGLEPGTTVPKTVVISISPQRLNAVRITPQAIWLLYYRLGERPSAYYYFRNGIPNT